MDFYDKPSLEDIEHYGVLGMKWGVRKNPQKAYSKSMKKLTRLDEKVSKARVKTAKAEDKAVRRLEKASSVKLLKNYANKKASRALKKNSRKYLSEQKKLRKAKKWADAMADAFKDVSVKSLKPENNSLGKKYIDLVIDNSEISSKVADMTQLITYYNKRR